MISHPIIVLTLLKSFILNFYLSWLFNQSSLFRLFVTRAKLSMDTPTIMNILFFWETRMHKFALIGIKLIFQKNLTTVLFQSFPGGFILFRLLKILQISPFDLFYIFVKFSYRLDVCFAQESFLSKH